MPPISNATSKMISTVPKNGSSCPDVGDISGVSGVSAIPSIHAHIE